MADSLTFRFWGVRGSHPTPGAATVRFGGNTACVEVNAGEKTLILDAGTGIISLGRDLTRRASFGQRPWEAVLLFSHLHHDHTQGFPFFAPAYLPHARLHIFGPGITPETLETVLAANQSPQTFPVGLREMASAKDIRSLRETETVVWDETGVHITEAGQSSGKETLVVHIRRSYAHPGGVYFYRVEWRGRSLVYATDTEGYVGGDQRLVKFAHGADVLIHDAQYSEKHYRGHLAGFPSTQGYGHSTVNMACEVAVAAGVRQLFLFHHEPTYDDQTIEGMEKEAQARFPLARAAFEGLEVSLSPLERPALQVNDRLAGKEKWKVQYASHG